MDSCFRKNSDKKNKEKNEILSLFSNGIIKTIRVADFLSQDRFSGFYSVSHVSAV